MDADTTTENGRALTEQKTRAPMIVQSGYALFDSAKFEHMQRIATAMAAARLVPGHLQGSVGDCLMIVELAFRLGVSPFMLAQKTYLVDKKIGYEAQVVAAMVNTNPILEGRLRVRFEGEGGDLRCIVTGKLRGEAEPFIKTSPRVKDIKVKNSPLWAVDPEQQLGYWTQRAWARLHTPEIILGVYTPDDIDAMLDVTPPRPQRPDEYEDTTGGEAEVPPTGQSSTAHTAAPPTQTEDGGRKQRTRAAAPPVEFHVVDLDGQEIAYPKAATAATAFENEMALAAKRSEMALEGLWESNGLFLTELRENGRGSTADSMAKQYSEHLDELAKAAAQERQPAKTEPRKEVVPDNDSQSGMRQDPQPKQRLQSARADKAPPPATSTAPAAGAPAANGLVPWTFVHPDYKSVPNRPKPFGQGNIFAFFPWLCDQLRDMPKEQVADFLSDENYGKEFDHFAEKLPDDYAEIKRVLAKKGVNI